MTIAPEAPAATETPSIYRAIAQVMRDTTPVGKDQVNEHQRYRFRGIDDLMSAVAGPMRAHGVFIVPEVIDRTTEQRGKMLNVTLTMRYRIFGPSGDYIEAVVPGEASDTADKATNKAMSAAFKYLLLQVLMIPVDARSIDDGDRDHPENEPQQQRRNGQQRGERQPRRSKRAEPGPWEQAQPPAQQQPQQDGGQWRPSRDYLAEAAEAPNPDALARIMVAARKEGAPSLYLSRLDDIREALTAPDVAAVRKLWEAAKATGAPRVHLARLAAIGERKPAPQQGGQQGPTPPRQGSTGGSGTADGRATAHATASPPREALDPVAAARQDMYAAAHAAGLTQGEAVEAFRAAHGCHPTDATADQLSAQAADLRAAVKGQTA